MAVSRRFCGEIRIWTLNQEMDEIWWESIDLGDLLENVGANLRLMQVCGSEKWKIRRMWVLEWKIY